MNWFLIAMIAPALYAACNHIDKYLIEKYLAKDPGQKEDVGALILFSSLFAGSVLPVIYLFERNVFALNSAAVSALIVNGILCVGAIVLYLYAMENDEASIVVPFYQLIPVIGYMLGVLLLGELLSPKQMFSSLAVILAAAVLSMDLAGERIRIRRRVVLLMLGSSSLFALSGVIFKKIAVEQSFWISAFWELAGMFLAGCVIFIAVPLFRKDFLRLVRRSSRPILFLNLLSETLTIIGDLIFMYAYLLAPIALVMVANVFQPLFVFVYGVILTLYFPRIATERLSKRLLMQKIGAIAVMMMGAYFLYF